MQSLRSFNYVGNPFEGTKKSRDYVLMMGLSIIELNLKNVMAHEREFLFKFHKIRHSSSGRPQLGKLGVSESDMGGGKDEKNLSVNGEWVD